MPELIYEKNKRYYYMSVNYNYSPSIIEADITSSCILDLNILYSIASQKKDFATIEKLKSVFTNSLVETNEGKLTLTKNSHISSK